MVDLCACGQKQIVWSTSVDSESLEAGFSPCMKLVMMAEVYGTRRMNFSHVVDAHVPLSPSSII